MLCEYGCGNEAKFKLKIGKNCCSEKSNKCPNVRRKNSEGLKKAHAEGKMKSFSEEAQKRSNKVRLENIQRKPFEHWGKELKKKFIFFEQDGKCLWCKLSEWLNKPISLELDHIDGNRDNNRRENLRLLCPNCHSQTKTYKSKNAVIKGKKKISNEEIIKKLKEVKSINKTIEFFNYNPNATVYKRIYKIIKENNLEFIFLKNNAC